MQTARRAEEQRSLTSPIHHKYECFASLSIVCFLDSSIWLSDAAVLANLQTGLLYKAVFLVF